MLNLNSDKLIVVVKPEQQPVIYTGYTATYITGSGITVVSEPQPKHFVIYTPAGGVHLIGSGDTTVVGSGSTWIIFSNTGATVFIFID